MKRLLGLNICICILVTFLFELLDGSNMIPSQYRLGIAAIILIIDVICAIIAIIEKRISDFSQLSTCNVRNKKPPAMRVER